MCLISFSSLLQFHCRSGKNWGESVFSYYPPRVSPTIQVKKNNIFCITVPLNGSAILLHSEIQMIYNFLKNVCQPVLNSFSDFNNCNLSNGKGNIKEICPCSVLDVSHHDTVRGE